MFSFKASFFAALVAGTYASKTTYADFEPITVVTDHAAISEDQAAIEKYVKSYDEGSFATAQQIYEQGGNSKSYAEITLSAGLTQPVKKGATMTALDGAGKNVQGKALSDFDINDTIVQLQYPTQDDAVDYVRCRVGALPVEDQVTVGCIVTSGNLQIEGIATPLTYTAVVNKNARTIKGFSTSANTRMRPGDDPTKDYFDFFTPYLNYYGTNNYDFGHQIALAGFDGSATSFPRGNIDLAGYTFEGREQIAKKATAYIITGLYVQRELEDALYDCSIDCKTAECNDDAVHANDEAVAFYVGSQHAQDSDKLGNLFYGLADKRAANFATSMEVTEGISKANKQIMLEFEAVKSKLSKGECPEARANVDEIIRLMQIPLIQGTLRYAYFTSIAEDPTEAQQTEGAIFAAGILPLVYACNEDAAETIYDNMKLKPSANTKADYAAVKKAFESTYGCMKVSCEEIGGLVNKATGNTYEQGAAPCGGVNNLSGAGFYSLSVAVGAIAGIAALFM